MANQNFWVDQCTSPENDDLNGHIPHGVCDDTQGNLYLAEEALPLVLFKLDSDRLLKILMSPRSVNEAEAGRNLDLVPLSATEIMSRVEAVLLLGGFCDTAVKEACLLSLACHVIPDVSYGLATPELIDAVSSGLLTPHELQESSNWSKDTKLFCRTLKFGPLLRAITGRDIAKDMNDMPVLSPEVEPEQVGGKRKVVLQGATFEGDDDDIFG